MALLSQIYRHTILTPLIVLTAIPALIIAIITTNFALITLLLRTFAIGVDLALRFVPYYSLKPHPKQTVSRPQLRLRVSFTSVTSQGRRGSSTSPRSALPHSALSLDRELDATRDYEGVGGWQFSRKPEEHNILCESINSRLQLPGDQGRQRILSLSSYDSQHLR